MKSLIVVFEEEISKHSVILKEKDGDKMDQVNACHWAMTCPAQVKGDCIKCGASETNRMSRTQAKNWWLKFNPK
jgi:hypothetical protein